MTTAKAYVEMGAVSVGKRARQGLANVQFQRDWKWDEAVHHRFRILRARRDFWRKYSLGVIKGCDNIVLYAKAELQKREERLGFFTEYYRIWHLYHCEDVILLGQLREMAKEAEHQGTALKLNHEAFKVLQKWSTWEEKARYWETE